MDWSNSTTCEVCGRRMATARALQSHLRIHTGERPFKCAQCSKTYLSNDSLGAHKRSKHKRANTRGYQLNVCFSNIMRNNFQKQTIHPDNTCCKKGKKHHNTTKADSRIGKRIGDEKHGTREITQSEFMMDDHVVSTFKVGEKNPEQSEVNRHRQINLIYASDIVPQPSVDVTCFNSDKNHADHHLKFQSRDLNTQRCSHYNDEAIVGSALKRNRGSDNLPEPDFGVQKKSKLTLQNGKQILEKCYKSNPCQRSFGIKKGFEEHIMPSNCQTGGEKRVFECVVCDRVFVSKYLLARHIRIHTAEKPSQCDVCEKRFSRRDYMLNHMKRIHKYSNGGNAAKFDGTKISQTQV